MKVLLVSKYAKTGGAAIAAGRLLDALAGGGVEAKMLVQEEQDLARGIYSTTGSPLKKALNFYRFVEERLQFAMRERSRDVRFLFSPASVGESINRNPLVKEADIIHLHWITGAFLSLGSIHALLRLGKPVVWTLHDMWAFTGGCHYSLDCERYMQECGNCPYLKKPGPHDLSHRVWKRKNKVFMERRITVITPSRWLAGCAGSSSLLSEQEVVVIPNPLDDLVFKPERKEEARRRLGLNPTMRYILFGAANIDNMLKGFGYFAEAIRILHQEMKGDNSIGILLFGKSKGEVSQLFPFPVHSIPFTGTAVQIADIYSAAHMFVIPSLQDNLPNTIAESMLCGTPAVGFRTGGIPEMIVHRQNGYLADHRSASDLAAGMKWLLETPDYEEITAGARNKAVIQFSRESALQKHVELYQKLLGG